jgi:tripartite-type tricarboxylate transporter receptor subunit TctC
MKPLKKILSLALALAMLLVLCTACGGSSSTEPAASTPAASEPAATTDNTAAPAEPAAETPKIDYPTGPITLIVNYSAGGGTDLMARALAEAASNILGQPITVENKTGGTGTVGIAELQNSKNDGYTIGVATLAPLAMVPWQMEVPYTPDDFEYICAFGQYGYGIVVAADSPYQTLADLVAAAKTDKVNFGGTGYPQPLAMEAINKAEGTNFTFVSYPKTADLITDVLGGFIPFAVADQASFTAYVKDGSMRLLASATDIHWPAAPDVKTLQENGYDVALLSYMGLCAPKGIDPAQLQILQDAFKQAFNDATFQDIAAKSNLVPVYMSGDDYSTMVHEKYTEYQQVFADMK